MPWKRGCSRWIAPGCEQADEGHHGRGGWSIFSRLHGLPFLLLVIGSIGKNARARSHAGFRPLGGLIAEGIHLVRDHADEAIIVRVVAQLHPAHPAFVGGIGLAGLISCQASLRGS